MIRSARWTCKHARSWPLRSLEVGGKPGRGEELLELLPASLRLIGSASPALDVAPDQVLTYIVIDDVAPVLIQELDALPGPIGGHHGKSGEPVRRLHGVDLTVQVAPTRLVAGVVQLLDQLQHIVVGARSVRVESGQRKEDIPLELDALLPREGHLDAEVRAPFGDEALGAEQGIAAELDPPTLFEKVLLQERVVDVVPRVPL